MKKETSKYNNVFYEDKHVCNKGRARYQLDLAPIKKFPVSLDFAASVCVLPEEYDEKAYFNFIERWGTVSILNRFVWIEVSLGEMKEMTIYFSDSAGPSFVLSAIVKNLIIGQCNSSVLY